MYRQESCYFDAEAEAIVEAERARRGGNCPFSTANREIIRSNGRMAGFQRAKASLVLSKLRRLMDKEIATASGTDLDRWREAQGLAMELAAAIE
jgi:hypothetical protein